MRLATSFLISSAVAVFGWVPFSGWMAAHAATLTVMSPIGPLAPLSPDAAGAALILPVAFLMACLGIGLMVSDFFFWLMSTPAATFGMSVRSFGAVSEVRHEVNLPYAKP